MDRTGWKESAGRLGLFGKGAVFVILGLLAIQLATGDTSGDPSRTGAVEWLAGQPFGRFLLLGLTVSLFAFAVWRLTEVVTGDPVEGDDAIHRVKFAVQGLLYLSLAGAALSATVSNWSGPGNGTEGTTGDGGASEQRATSTVMEWPGGRWLVVVAGLAIIGYSLYLGKKHALDAEFDDRLEGRRPSWVRAFGRIGYAARTVAFVVIGYLLIEAGITYEAGRSRGLSGALQELAGEGWGQAVLWGIAVGLVAFGLFTAAEARYRRAA